MNPEQEPVQTTTVEHPPALVLGGGITALGAVRSLGRAGIPLHVVSTVPAFVRASRWHRPPPDHRRLDDFARLPEYLRALPLDKAVLIPTSDHAARAIAALPEDLAARFPASQAPAPVIAQLTDKQAFERLLDKHGIPRPRTFPVSGPEDLPALPEADLANFFIKPRDSQAFDRHFGVKAFWPQDRRELLRRLAQIRDAGLAVVLQEYLPGPPGNHYFLDGFIDRHGQQRAQLVRRRLRMSPPDFGNSCATVSLPPDAAAPAAEHLGRLLSAIGYRGPFDAEFKQHAGTGEFHLVEINVRPWWQAEFVSLCGIDVVNMCYRDALELPVADVAGYRVGKQWILPFEDLAAWGRALRAGELGLAGLGRWGRSWLTSHWAGWAADDPLPGLVSQADMLRRLLRVTGRQRKPAGAASAR